MRTARVASVSAGMLAVGVALWWWIARPAKAPPASARPERSSAATTATPRAAPLESDSPPEDTPARERAAVVDRRRADQLREALRALIADAGPFMGEDDVPDAGEKPGFPEMPAALPGDNSKAPLGEYIQARVREDFFPMALKCYDEALVTHPKLTGKVILKFKIVGDRKVGGVVDEATIDEKSDLRDPKFSLCLTESMMGVSFDAPPGPKRELTVSYPIDFSPDDPDSGT